MTRVPAIALISIVTLTACGSDEPADTSGETTAATTTEAGYPTPGADGPLGAVPVPADNPLTEAKIALGHQLFYEPRLSVDGSRSCYSCHQNEDGNGGREPTAIGAADRQLTRHAPVIWNVAYMPRFYWDGRSGSLEAQARGAWGGGNMGVGADNLDAKAAEIGAIAGYAEQFAEVFPDRGATAVTVSEAIASYERTLVCDDTRFDQYQAGQANAMTATEVAGMELFQGKAGCVTCHTPPFFSTQILSPDGMYYNVGVGIEGKDESEVDVGRQAVSELDTDWAAFKVPSLRNVAQSPPYFHDGSVATLEEAIQFMAAGGYPNRNRTPMLTNRSLTDDEVSSIAAFLGALDCGSMTAPELPGE